jgi:hypothetical protein
MVVLGLLGSYIALLAWAWQNTSYDIWGAIVIAPLLVAITVPIVRRVAAAEGDPTMARLLIGALVLKLAMSLVRYAVAFEVYGGSADAAVYHRWGKNLSALFRTGDLHTLGQPLSGTGFMRVLTGVVYTVSGPTKLGGFVIFSWFGYWGLYFFYRAFRLAVPDGDHRRYARLVLLLPSMLFWPSSIGKEAWMSLGVGMAAYGTAKLLAGRRGAVPLLALGLTLASIVRPHIGLIFFVGLVVVYMLRRARRRRVLGAIPKLLGLLLLAGAGLILVSRTEDLVKVDDITTTSGTDAAFASVQERSDSGGSTFETTSPTSPAGFAYAALTVLYRPFPQEAGNIQALMASAEGMAMLGLSIISLPRVLSVLRSARDRPYPLLALVYVLIFCWAFASVGNFGILTRQRVQVLPFLLVLLALPNALVRAPRPVDART